MSDQLPEGLFPDPEAIDKVLKEYNYPSNPRNAARAGWTACWRAMQSRNTAIPEGYKVVLVPDEPCPPEPDWDECVRQAELAIGVEVDRNTFSIIKREIRRWIAHIMSEQAESPDLIARRNSASARVAEVIPTGSALVPLRPNAEMNRVTQEEGWQWDDVLDAAGAVTEKEYDALQVSATWSSVEKRVDTYLEDYELIGEGASGKGTCHQPDEVDKFVIKDAIMGLLDNEFVSLLASLSVAAKGRPVVMGEVNQCPPCKEFDEDAVCPQCNMVSAEEVKRITKEAAQWGSYKLEPQGNGSTQEMWTFSRTRLCHLVRSLNRVTRVEVGGQP